MYPISSSGETSPTGSGQHELAVSDEQPDTIMTDAGTENVYGIPERKEIMAPGTQGYERGKVSDAPKLLKIQKKHSTSSHPEKTYSSHRIKIQQIHAFDYGSDQEISTGISPQNMRPSSLSF